MKNIHAKNVSEIALENTRHFFYAISAAGILTLATLVGGCKTTASNENFSSGSIVSVAAVTHGADEISVMTFNVENMFDNIHNEGIDDYTYLPHSQKNTEDVMTSCNKLDNPFYRQECFNKDWNDDVIDFKLSQVASVISYVDGGLGPDNLFLAEVENENILNQLVKKHLADKGYKTISILKGPDTRGINTAFISKFPQVGKSILHIIPYQDADPARLKYAQKSRGILETVVKINGKNVSFLTAHFPSQSNPTDWRKQAMKYMKDLMLEIQKKGQAVIAGGDLNTTNEEEQEFGYFSKILAQGGSVSHLVGCKNCKGTHSYKGGWSFLDVMVYSPNLPQAAGLNLIPESIEVVRTPMNTKRNGTPLRFDEGKREGVSDHFPLYSRLKITTPIAEEKASEKPVKNKK
ncbi:MAG: endonuclease/exonuclease/phosphatase family protein [Bdellovibrionaceae bacterium]|nr:endonuclease/exonuclease/phosphatase family protein [Pseudobdellovibrionaceae bacterium]